MNLQKRLDAIEDRTARLQRPQTAAQERLARMSTAALMELRTLRIRLDTNGCLSDAEKARVRELLGNLDHTRQGFEP